MPRGQSNAIKRYNNKLAAKRRARINKMLYYKRNRVKQPYKLYIGVKTKVVCIPLRKIEILTINQSFVTTALEFKVTDFQLSSAWTNLFEFYKITSIKQTIYPDTQAANAPTVIYDNQGSITGAQLNVISHPLLLTRTERDGEGSAPSNIEDCLKNPAYKVKSLRKGAVIKYKPNILDQVYETSLQTGYSPKFNQWISTQDTDVLHFGMRRAVSAKTASATYPLTYRVITTAVVEFKNLRYEENN